MIENGTVCGAVGGEMMTIADYDAGMKIKDDGSRVYTINCRGECGAIIHQPKLGAEGGYTPIEPQVMEFSLRFPGGQAGEQSRGISRKDLGKLIGDTIMDTRDNLARLLPNHPESVLARLIGARCYVKARTLPKKDGSEMVFWNCLVPEQLVAATLDNLADLLPDGL